jgi:hypothetical protein
MRGGGRHRDIGDMLDVCAERDRRKKELPCPNLLKVVGANPRKDRDFLNLMVNETSALGDSPVFLGSPGDLDCFGLACAVANTDAMEVEGSGEEGPYCPYPRSCAGAANGIGLARCRG